MSADPSIRDSGATSGPDVERGMLGTRARSGMVWSLLNSAAARVFNVLAGLVIARVVTPNEFGTFTVALLVMTVVLSMNEAGISVAVVRWKEGVDRVTPTAISCSLASSAFWFALMALGAPVIAALLNAPEATTAIRVLSVGVLLDGISTIPSAMLMRTFQQRRRAAAQLLGLVIGSPIGIFLASKSGAVGLAVGVVIANAVTTAMILRLAPLRFRLGWNRETAERLLRLGLPPALTSVLLLAIVNVDFVVVSRVLGVGALGFYALAFNVANWPWTLLSMSIRQVSLPAFSRLADDPAGLEEAFSHSLTLTAALATLGGVLLAALAGPVVGILYGDEWLPAAAALQWLAVLGAVRVILELCYDLLVAVGRANVLARLQIGWLVALAVTLPIGAHLGGIAGVAIAQGAVAAVLVLPLNIWLLAGSGLRLGPLFRALQPVGAAAVASAAVALLALQVDVPRGVTLGGVGILITLAFGATFLASHRGRAALRWAGPSSSSSQTPPVRPAPVQA